MVVSLAWGRSDLVRELEGRRGLVDSSKRAFSWWSCDMQHNKFVSNAFFVYNLASENHILVNLKCLGYVRYRKG